jgi:effector-binding domain-containing protein
VSFYREVLRRIATVRDGAFSDPEAADLLGFAYQGPGLVKGVTRANGVLQAERLELEQRLLRNEMEVLEAELRLRQLRAQDGQRQEARVKERQARRDGTPELVEVPPCWVLATVHTGPLEGLKEVVAGLFEFAEQKGMKPQGPVLLTFLRHPDGEPQACETEAAVLLAARDDYQPWVTKSHELKLLPAARVLTLRIVGPYEEASASVERLFEAARERGLEVVGPLRSIHHDDPGAVPAEQLRTDLQVPVAAGR